MSDDAVPLTSPAGEGTSSPIEDAESNVSSSFRAAHVPPIERTLGSLLVAASSSLLALIGLAQAQQFGIHVTDEPSFFISVQNGCLFAIMVQACAFHVPSPLKDFMIKDSTRLSLTGKLVFWMIGLFYVCMISICVKYTGGTNRSLFSIFYSIIVAITLIGSVHVRHGLIMAVVCSYAAWIVLEVPLSEELVRITESSQYSKVYFVMFVYALFTAVAADAWRNRLTESRRSRVSP